MGANNVSHGKYLDPSWQRLAEDLLSTEYREAIGRLTDLDLRDAPMEVNVFHYGPRASLGPHVDLPDKIATHVFYFNQTWTNSDGGCLTILGSPNPADVASEIAPIIDNSVVLVRSDNSWHAVTPVRSESADSRRSMTVTFYRPGSPSTMWPPGDKTPLHDYPDREPDPGTDISSQGQISKALK